MSAPVKRVLSLAGSALVGSALGGLLAPATTAFAASGGGMPQLNHNDFVPQLVWLVIVFVVLYIVLSKAVLPRIGTVIEDRQARLASDLDAAEKLRADAEKARADYEAALTKARATAQEASGKAREQVATESAARRAKVDHDLGDKMRAADAAIAAAKTKALGEIRGAAAEVAASAIQRITGQAPSADAVAAAIGAAGRGA